MNTVLRPPPFIPGDSVIVREGGSSWRGTVISPAILDRDGLHYRVLPVDGGPWEMVSLRWIEAAPPKDIAPEIRADLRTELLRRFWCASIVLRTTEAVGLDEATDALFDIMTEAGRTGFHRLADRAAAELTVLGLLPRPGTTPTPTGAA